LHMETTRALGAVTGALLLAGCAQLEYPNSGAAPAAQVSPPSAINADPSPPETHYQPPQPDPAPDPAPVPPPAPGYVQHDPGESFAHDMAQAGLTVGGIEITNRLLHRKPDVPAVRKPPVSIPPVPAEIESGGAGAAGSGVGAAETAGGAGAAGSGAGAAETAGGVGAAAAGATELEEWSAAAGRVLIWGAEECLLVFCR
jgi:hypothetical protein